MVLHLFLHRRLLRVQAVLRVLSRYSTPAALGVGKSFFGIEQRDSRTATVDHYDFGIANFNADAIRALGLNFVDRHSQESFKFLIPTGFRFGRTDLTTLAT